MMKTCCYRKRLCFGIFLRAYYLICPQWKSSVGANLRRMRADQSNPVNQSVHVEFVHLKNDRMILTQQFQVRLMSERKLPRKTLYIVQRNHLNEGISLVKPGMSTIFSRIISPNFRWVDVDQYLELWRFKKLRLTLTLPQKDAIYIIWHSGVKCNSSYIYEIISTREQWLQGSIWLSQAFVSPTLSWSKEKHGAVSRKELSYNLSSRR